MSPVPSLAQQSLAQSKSMSTETYLNHPTFGLLYRVCIVEESQELFATLYAQRLFFLVTNTPEGFQFDPVSRTDARLLLENRIRNLRRQGLGKEYEQLQKVHRQTFQ
ncbi:MAG: PipX family protein [Oculatellaceae cyanobacterium bins.114]|nr:PipX family protein [Oculatellaceae cyanobacterium bins.114]